jgi:hypothetical protein
MTSLYNIHASRKDGLFGALVMVVLRGRNHCARRPIALSHFILPAVLFPRPAGIMRLVGHVIPCDENGNLIEEDLFARSAKAWVVARGLQS